MAGSPYVPLVVRLPRGSSAPIVVLVAAGVVRIRAWEFWTILPLSFVAMCALAAAISAALVRGAKRAPLPGGARVVPDSTIRRVAMRLAVSAEVLSGVLIALGDPAAAYGASLAVGLAALGVTGFAFDRWWCRVTAHTGERLLYPMTWRALVWPEVLRTPPSPKL